MFQFNAQEARTPQICIIYLCDVGVEDSNSMSELLQNDNGKKLLWIEADLAVIYSTTDGFRWKMGWGLSTGTVARQIVDR